MVKSNRRPLSKVEVNINQKQIENIEKRNMWLSFQVEYYDLMLNKGLEQNYLKTIREYKEIRKGFDDELKLNERVVKELGIQIADGVEIKNVVEVKKKTIEEIEDNKERDRSYIG